MNIHSHFGVYAVTYNEDRTRILLIKKARGPYTGLYDLPGGSPEETELLEEALIREVLEETNCTVTDYSQIGCVSTRYEYHKDEQDGLLRHLGVLFNVTIEGDIKTDADGEDSDGAIWMPIEQVSEENSTPFVLLALKN